MISLSKLFLIFFLSFSLESAAFFQSQAVANCTTYLTSCGNDFLADNITTFSNCTKIFESCLSNIPVPPRPEACYISDAAWTNFYLAATLFVVVFGLANGAMPAITKSIAWGITKCMNLDPTKFFFLRKCGDFCAIFANSDGDRKVTATELLSPQTIITILSAGFPIALLTTAISQDAMCAYATALYHYNYPL